MSDRVVKNVGVSERDTLMGGETRPQSWNPWAIGYRVGSWALHVVWEIIVSVWRLVTTILMAGVVKPLAGVWAALVLLSGLGSAALLLIQAFRESITSYAPLLVAVPVLVFLVSALSAWKMRRVPDGKAGHELSGPPLSPGGLFVMATAILSGLASLVVPWYLVQHDAITIGCGVIAVNAAVTAMVHIMVAYALATDFSGTFDLILGH
mmetsp:Transcript_12169/g.24828  ORF Transcript_12169/g.24828 Transcript_12169/m.24828 type:complete len:208 (+) Transcript_12169:73-696(+)|eukprot:CAMPEP_0184681440 /NCGR_PEP_ID=MMETSP0312-20130426/4420_1 /TAXON_ID=31354 /ORGANISM="Compsopogon coeruleus, Strain SAG 36.94" /LENGTH=207 /DNA_ID=CAMNT_0027132297 /DNA_START=61 /DNA_END=684 /DNA_ORIENTATION=+